METTVCKLTLVVPTDATDRIVELILASDPPVTGFTTWNAEGHGESFATASIAERVRGRVRRGVIVAIMDRARASSLVAEIGQKTPIPHMAYWMEPVLEFGRASISASGREQSGVTG